MDGPMFQMLVVILSWLAVPVFIVWAYDKWVAAPKRPKNEQGEPVPGPVYAQVADWLLVPAIVAVVMTIGVGTVFDWLKQVAEPLSWIAPPIGLWLLIDSWLLAPRRRIARGIDAPDPPLLRIAYFILPVLVVAVIVRMISADSLDFSLVLFVLSVATGVVWAIDSLFFRKSREAAFAKIVPKDTPVPEPGTVDYARSFFPVAFIVLIVRAFIFEPFRIPSDSMMPTLLDGDFIVVSKYAYGLRWPVLNEKFLPTSSPQRGDVVVFRYPPDPKVNYIKRLVGLPGDRIEVHDDHLVVNGETIPLQETTAPSATAATSDCSCRPRSSASTRTRSCPAVRRRAEAAAELAFSGIQRRRACDRKKLARRRGLVCARLAAIGRRTGQ
jgi:signal peptidase I